MFNWPVRLAELDWMRQINSDTFDSQYIDQKNCWIYRIRESRKRSQPREHTKLLTLSITF